MTSKKCTFRTRKMIEGVVSDRRAGMGTSEICRKYGISHSTFYNRIGEAAEQCGISREELLVQPGRGKSEASRVNQLVRESGLDQLTQSVEEKTASTSEPCAAKAFYSITLRILGELDNLRAEFTRTIERETAANDTYRKEASKWASNA